MAPVFMPNGARMLVNAFMVDDGGKESAIKQK